MLFLLLQLIVLNVWFTNGENLINLAYKKPTWQSSTDQLHSSERAVDGLKSKLYAAGNQCAISKRPFLETFAMWFVDLEAIQTINHVKIYYRTEDITWDSDSMYAKRLANFSLYVSNTTAKEQGVLCYHADINDDMLSSPEITINCSVPGRFVIYYNERSGRVNRLSQYAYLDLCEVEVFGCPYGFYGQDCSLPCPKYCRYCDPYSGQCLGGCSLGYFGQHCEHYWRKNLAYGKPTSQTFDSNGDTSGRAVDGKSNYLSESVGQCMTSDGYRHRLQAFVYVDLGGVSEVERVIINFFTGNNEWGPGNTYTSRALGFSVVVSNYTVPIKGKTCYRDAEYDTSTIPAVIDIDCPVVGRYVFFVNERLDGVAYPKGYSAYAYANICEMEVYGCPVPGFNGPNCSVPCSAMCDDPCPSPIDEIAQCSESCPANCQQCYPDTGICQKCQPGYTGETCESACNAKAPIFVAFPDSVFNANQVDDIYTSTGLNVSHKGDDFNYLTIMMRWREEPADIASISVTMEFSAEFGIYFKTELGESVKKGRPFYGPARGTLTVENPFISRVNLIVLSIKYKTPINISDLTLKLRKCMK